MGSCTLSLWVIVVVIARSFLCLQQQPGSLLGFAPSWARAHLQHTMLSPNITLESCRCSAFVFTEKQILGMVKAMSSKHTVLERDVLEVPFPVCNCKSGGRKRHWKTAGKRGGKCILRKWWKSPQCAKLQSLLCLEKQISSHHQETAGSAQGHERTLVSTETCLHPQGQWLPCANKACTMMHIYHRKKHALKSFPKSDLKATSVAVQNSSSEYRAGAVSQLSLQLGNNNKCMIELDHLHPLSLKREFSTGRMSCPNFHVCSENRMMRTAHSSYTLSYWSTILFCRILYLIPTLLF